RVEKVVHTDPLRTHLLCFWFFFQAEDGIRDRNVTGVQTCALPISNSRKAVTSGSSLGSILPAGISKILCSKGFLYCSTKISSFSFVKAIIATDPECFTSSLLLVLPLGKLISSTCRLTTLPSKILFLFNVFHLNAPFVLMFFIFSSNINIRGDYN